MTIAAALHVNLPWDHNVIFPEKSSSYRFLNIPIRGLNFNLSASLNIPKQWKANWRKWYEQKATEDYAAIFSCLTEQHVISAATRVTQLTTIAAV